MRSPILIATPPSPLEPRRRSRPGWLLLPCALLLSATAARSQARLFDHLHQMIPADSDATLALALGDVDGDGDPDLVAGNRVRRSNPGQNRLALNDGSGRFVDATATHLPADSDFTVAVALGDVDGDGDPDLCAFGGQNRLYLNDGTGSFTRATATHLPADSNGTSDVALGDVDGDGDRDLVVAGNVSTPNRLYLNDGTGVFTDATATHLPADSDRTRTLILGDVDGDGDPDLVLGNLGQSRLYSNDGAGVFTDVTATHLPVETQDTRALALGDVDADGDLDLVLGNWSFVDRNLLYLNDGTGLFTDATATHLPADRIATVALAMGDVDADTDLDLVLANHSGEQRVYLNDGSGVFSDTTATHLPAGVLGTWALVLGDVDADGDPDLVLGNTFDQNRLYLNDGRGVFADATATPLPADWHRTRHAAFADVDLDGDPDLGLVAPDVALEQKRLYLNDGTGFFSDATATRLPPEPDPRPRALAWGDVDGDGDPDLLIGNHLICTNKGGSTHCRAFPNRIYLNDGAGFFTDVSATHLPPHADPTLAVAFGDVDADGDLDLAVGNWRGPRGPGGPPPGFPGPNRLYLNDGSGRFADATATHLPGDSDTAALAFADVDGDGDPDLVLGNDGQDRLYRNDGTGIFTDVTRTHLPPDADRTTALALGDVDGDNDPDLVIAGVLGDQPRSRLYLNDGAGVFADASATHLPSMLARRFEEAALALADLDGDGDADLLFTFVYRDRAPHQRLFVNDGTGRFTDATRALLPDAPPAFALALADVDRDGDPDLALATDGQTRLLRNLTRQLAWRGLPRVGQPLTMDVYGSPFGFWLLLASRRAAEIPLPIGTLRLDPSRHVQVGAGLLDPRGRAAVTHAVPDDPSLVGFRLFWQAVVTAPVALTNLEVTAFHGL